ncbi:MAG: hypothetical protein AAF518_11315 [Spirochaetota bacterium]
MYKIFTFFLLLTGLRISAQEIYQKPVSDLPAQLQQTTGTSKKESTQKPGNKQKRKKRYKTLSVKTSEIRLDRKNKRFVYSPESYVKKASYTHYYFPYNNFLKKLGKNWKKKDTVKLRVRIVRLKRKNYDPNKGRSKPIYSVPDGGFNNRYYYARIIRVIR